METQEEIGGAFDSVITRIKNGWCKFRDLVLLLASRGLPLGAKGRLYFARVCSVMLYRNKTSPVKEKDLIRLEKNDTWMVR